MRNYKELSDYLAKGRNTWERPIPNKRATRVIRKDYDTVAIRYWHTNVVVFCRDGRVILDASKWETATTKLRMNQHLPQRWLVYQKDFVWYLHDRDADTSHEFYNGITIYPNGTVSKRE